MNRLRNQICYLSGAMEFMPDFGADWRKKLQSDLEPLNIVFLDPTDKPIDVLDEQTLIANIKRARATGDYDSIADDVKLIRHVDLRMTDMAGFLIVNLDLTIPTCGTWEELFTANKSKKPILVRMVQGKEATPAWLFGAIPHQMIFSTWEELYSYLYAVDAGEDVNSYNRWLFFDLA